MTLKLTPEESLRLQKQLELSAKMSRETSRVPEEKRNLVIQNYRAGQSISYICRTCHVSRETVYKIRNEFERWN